MSDRVVFWYGCNASRHGDILHLAVDLLRAAGIEVTPAGGASYCCGTSRDSNLRAAEGMAKRTVQKFNATGADQVVTWCPSCHRHMNQFMGEYNATNFSVGHITQVLHAHREKLAKACVREVPRRVLLHKHVGFREVAELNGLVASLLGLVPGLTLIDDGPEVPGHMCSALAGVPAAVKDVTRGLCEHARAVGADDVVTVFHSCQRMLCGLESTEPFRVTNYVTLLGLAMGLEYRDEYKAWKNAGDEAAILAMIGPERIGRVGEEAIRTTVLPELVRRPGK